MMAVAAASAVASTLLVAYELNATPLPALSAAALLQIGILAALVLAWRANGQDNQRLQLLADSDPGTGCLNRRGFWHVLERAADRKRNVAMLALDLDHFKRINDGYGHSVGDVVLKEVSHALMATVGPRGCVARLGGEEFGVLVLDADAEFAGVLAERMVCRLRALRISVLKPRDSVTMSIGIATEQLTSPRQCAALCARADEALYIAKRRGRDRALLWAPGVPSHATPAASMAAIGSRHSARHPS